MNYGGRGRRGEKGTCRRRGRVNYLLGARGTIVNEEVGENDWMLSKSECEGEGRV